MNLLIVGAGASAAVGGLPMPSDALERWLDAILNRHHILGLALDSWVGRCWDKENLEVAWGKIDGAWNERIETGIPFRARELTDPEREKVWELADLAARTEPDEPNYYRTQIRCARAAGWTAEQSLSVAAGWELRKLIQATFAATTTAAARGAYGTLLGQLEPSTVISFNYDTLLEQCLPSGRWSYDASAELTVLKPHGSVNWTHDLGKPERVQIDIDLPADAMGYWRGGLKQNLVVGLRPKVEHTGAEGSSVVHDLMKTILDRCEDAIAEADSVWVLGYSFPAADATFRDVMSRGIARRSRSLEASLIDKRDDPAPLLKRLRCVFHLPDKAPLPHCFCGFMDWCSHGFCSR